MPTLRVELEAPIPAALQADLREKVPYLSRQVRSATISPSGRVIELELAEGADAAVIEADLRRLATAICRGHRPTPASEPWSARHPIAVRDVWAEAAGRGLVWESGPGLVALGGDAVRVLEGLRTHVGRLAAALGAQPRQYPGLIAIAALDRCHYFSSFPHHVTFAPHVRENLQDLQELAGDVAGEIARHLEPPTHLLSPAVCFHAYHQLAGQALAAPQVLTATGRCVRYESLNLARLERSWEFTMQEIIFIGERTWVAGARQQAMDEVRGWITRWGLSAWLELATDPFFMTNFAAKRYHQLLTEAKFELRLDLGERSLAAASFNVHSDFFGQSFAIGLEGGWADTGCVAFGLERWVWALFTQLGTDLAAWPAALRRDLDLEAA